MARTLRMNATIFQDSLSGRPEEGITVPGMPFLTTSKIAASLTAEVAPVRIQSRRAIAFPAIRAVAAGACTVVKKAAGFSHLG